MRLPYFALAFFLKCGYYYMPLVMNKFEDVEGEKNK